MNNQINGFENFFTTNQSLQQTEMVINTTPPPPSYQNLYNLHQIQEKVCRQKIVLISSHQKLAIRSNSKTQNMSLVAFVSFTSFVTAWDLPLLLACFYIPCHQICKPENINETKLFWTVLASKETAGLHWQASETLTGNYRLEVDKLKWTNKPKQFSEVGVSSLYSPSSKQSQSHFALTKG